MISHAIWLYFRFPLTIRTQSTVLSRHWAITIGPRVVQQDNMADLQAALMHDEALDDELQNGLPVGKGGALQAIMDALGEGSHVGQNLLGLGTLSTELKLLFLLLLQGSALVGRHRQVTACPGLPWRG